VEAEGAKVKATLCQQVVCVVAMMKGSRGVGEGEKVLGSIWEYIEYPEYQDPQWCATDLEQP
jgi:hypothetical protein